VNALPNQGRKVEFVCAVCLFAVYSYDDDPRPLCIRGHGRMTPEEQPTNNRAIQRTGKPTGRPRSSVRRRAAAL
jgi:hypothetical protein